MKKLKGNGLLSAILISLGGIILIIWPGIIADIIANIIAAGVGIIGLVYVIQYCLKDMSKDVYRKDLTIGLVLITFGIILFLNKSIVQNIIPFILGIIVLISGINKVQNAIDLLRLKANNWAVILVFAVINVAFGIILLVQPAWIVKSFFRIIGFALLYSGISDLVAYGVFTKGVGKYTESSDEIFQEQPKNK